MALSYDERIQIEMNRVKELKRKQKLEKPCTFHKYIKQDDVNAEMFGIVRDIFQRNSVSEGQAVESKKNRMLSKMAEMDASDPLYDELYDNYSNLIRGFTLEIVDIDSQIQNINTSIESNGARKESVERVKDMISEMWDHLDILPQEYVKQFMDDFIDEIQIYEEPDRIHVVAGYRVDTRDTIFFDE